MVFFILGDIDSGKSTRFLSLFHKTENQIGLFSKKLYDENNSIVGYNLVLLPEYKEMPFIKLRDSISNQTDSEFYFRGRFAFSKNSFKIGENYILDNLTEYAVWIDEIGGLELKGLGYDNLLKKLLVKDIDLVLSIRKSLFKSILERYRIGKYRILN